MRKSSTFNESFRIFKKKKKKKNQDDPHFVKKWKIKQQLRGHADDIFGVCWSSDGTTIFSCGVGNTVIAWDVLKGQIKQQWNLHKHYVQGICFDPSGESLLTISADKTVKIYASKQKNKRKRKQDTNPSLQMLSKEVQNWDCQTTIGKGENGNLFYGENLPVFFRTPAYSPDGQGDGQRQQ
eukprot:TRINITY_DN23334_c0_g1_i2.p2 TRINITY_DN23334_c0_g1~~TRINITY_DN23334_c0_g1_i2.p2  ORF type:complete len:181 (-),score=20.72 TRINITY_DN23334_c0_g1_i2:7-549(-)